MHESQFLRLKSKQRESVEILIDGKPHLALAGDTLLTALLSAGKRVRKSDIDEGWRAGFCLMSACQDCWVWLEEGARARACSTLVRPGISVVTTDPQLAP